MGDSTACYHFSMIFARMAREPDRYRDLAHFIYGVSREIDFHPCELELDDELIAWDLAKMGPNPAKDRYEDEPDEIVLYLGCDYGQYPSIYEAVELELGPEDEPTVEI